MQRQALSYKDTELNERGSRSFKVRFVLRYLPFILLVAVFLTVFLAMISQRSIDSQQRLQLSQQFASQAENLRMLILGRRTTDLSAQLAMIAGQLDLISISISDPGLVCVASFTSSEQAENSVEVIYPLTFTNGVARTNPAVGGNWRVVFKAKTTPWQSFVDSLIAYQLLMLLIVALGSVIATFLAYDRMVGEPVEIMVSALKNQLESHNFQPVDYYESDDFAPVFRLFNDLLCLEQRKELQAAELLSQSGIVWFSFAPATDTFLFIGGGRGITWLNASLIQTTGDLFANIDSEFRISFRQKWQEFKNKLQSGNSGSDEFELKMHGSGEDYDEFAGEYWASMKVFWSGSPPEVCGILRDISHSRKREQELQNFADSFRLLYDNSPIGIWRCVCHLDKYDYMNRTMAGILGYNTVEEALHKIGKISRDVFFNPGERAFFLDEVKRRNQVVNLEIRFKKADGSMFWGAIFGRLYIHEKVQYCEGGLIDITDRKQLDEHLRRSEEFFRLGLETSGIVIAQIDTLSEQVHFKGAINGLFGPGVTELTTLKNIQRLIHPEDLGHFNSTLEKARRNTNNGAVDKVPVDFRICRIDSGQKMSVRWLSLMAMRGEPIAGTRQHILHGVLVDITHQKETEQKLSDAVDSAMAESRLKSEFFAGISHEVRTPLNAIVGFSELLAPIVEDPRARQYISSILASSKSLINILNSLLDLNRLEAGLVELVPEPVRLADMVVDFRQNYIADADKIGVALKTAVDNNVPDLLLLDELRVRQIISNLLNNALRFTNTGSISLSVSATISNSRQTADLTISVEDTGHGIHPDLLKEIFKPLSEHHLHRSASSGGVGLGLSICHHLVNLMGGKIIAKSEIQCGSRFDVILPDVKIMDASTGVPITRVGRQQYRFSGQKILVADDTASNRELMAEAMRGAGLQVICASDGAEAVRLAIQEKPELIFMDIRMPVKDGVEATRELKSMPGLAEIPVVAVTASTSAREEKELSGLFDNFVYKPVSLVRLFAEAARYLGLKNTREGVVQTLVMPPEAFEQLHEPWKLVDSIDNTYLPRLKELESGASTAQGTELAEALKTLSVRHSFNHLSIEAEKLASCLENSDKNGIENSRQRINQILQQVLSVYSRKK